MEKELVFRNESGVAVTTSALVATIFEKEQFTVVRDIDNLVEKLHSIENQCPTKLEEHQQMFEAYYEDVIQPNGGVKSAKRYFMNKDGFTLLVMGYTGQKALEFKLKYINAFNKMEAQLIIANQQQAQLTQLFTAVCDKLTSTVETMNNRLELIEKRVLTVDKKKKPAKPKYLTISEAISVFAAKVRCIGKEDFYHCLRELEHLSKDEEDYNRPQGQYALTDMITAVNVKPNLEDADTEDQDFTLLITPGFLNIVIETVKWYEAYDMGYFSDLLVKDRPYCRK
ncbi:MAG: Rha family transcriptional regulator [Bacteroidaceae bacterium]|nr:Rha family transcriptional regulator [Bacteroidaceae bacterium]